MILTVLRGMPRYFFDVHDSFVSYDDTGVELQGLHEVRQSALRALPAIAADEIPMGGDRRHFTVLVKDDAGLPVYSATLSFIGMWLQRPPAAVAEPVSRPTIPPSGPSPD